MYIYIYIYGHLDEQLGHAAAPAEDGLIQYNVMY